MNYSDKDTDFDVQKFNNNFDKTKDLSKAKIKKLDDEKLNKLAVEDTYKNITEMTLFEILIGIKDSWFDLIDDLLQRQFSLNTFIKNNRLFYIGLTLIIVISILYLYEIIVDDVEVTNKKIVEIRHIYKMENDDGTLSKLVNSEKNNKLLDKTITAALETDVE
jgi:hypothetical protein